MNIKIAGRKMFGDDSPKDDDEVRHFSGKPPMPNKERSNNSKKNRGHSTTSTPERGNFKSKWEPRFSVKEPVVNKAMEK